MPVLLKAYQPPEELAVCREGDLFVVHNLTDKCVHWHCCAAPADKQPEQQMTPIGSSWKSEAGDALRSFERTSPQKLLHAEGASWRAGGTHGGGGWP